MYNPEDSITIDDDSSWDRRVLADCFTWSIALSTDFASDSLISPLSSNIDVGTGANSY